MVRKTSGTIATPSFGSDCGTKKSGDRGETTNGRGHEPRYPRHVAARLPAGTPAAQVDHLAGRHLGSGGCRRTIAAPGEDVQGERRGAAGSAERREPAEQLQRPVGLPAARPPGSDAG